MQEQDKKLFNAVIVSAIALKQKRKPKLPFL